MQEFIVAIKEHSQFGLILLPAVVRHTGKDKSLAIIEFISVSTLGNYKYASDKTMQSVVNLCHSYSDNELKRRFSKKATVKEFFASVETSLIDERIRPFIEKKMHQCFELLKYNNIRIFEIDNSKTAIYAEDALIIQRVAAKTVFNFHRTPIGTKYFLTIEHNGTEIKINGLVGKVLANKPCWLRLQNNIYFFDDIDGKKLHPFFDKEYILSPKRVENEYFEKFVLPATAKFKVNALGFKILRDTSEPKSIAFVEKDLAGDVAIKLKFRYNRFEVDYSDKTPVRRDMEFLGDSIQIHLLERNFEYEKLVEEFILSKGLKLSQMGSYKLNEAKPDAEKGNLYEMISWLNKNSAEIEQFGLIIERSREQQQFYIQDVRIDMQLHLVENSEGGSDWFDVDAWVYFGDYKIEFSSLKDNILRGKREFLLPNGEIAILPEEWFAEYTHLFENAEIEAHKLRIASQHFALIQDIGHEFKHSYLEKLSKLVNRESNSEVLVPQSIKAQLRNYQIVGYQWLLNLKECKLNGCLADDMGLGKTLQTITLMAKNAEQNKLNLIVAPVSLIHNWVDELNKFAPHLRKMVYRGLERKSQISRFKRIDIVISSYGTIMRDADYLQNITFDYIILDESQAIKNSDSKSYIAIKSLNSVHRLTLTGTPIQNSLADLWSQMNFINPGLLGSKRFFKETYQIPIEKQNDEKARKQLIKLISPFILRRTKFEVAKDLPELTEQYHYCEMSEEHRSLYETEKSKIRNFLITNEKNWNPQKFAHAILGGLMRLRLIANNPQLIDKQWTGQCSKFEEVVSTLESIVAEGHKVLLFSSFVKHLEIFAHYFDSNGLKYSTLTGKVKKRKEVIDEFKTDDDTKLFLISLKAGGVGLNLTEADYVFILDPWWNPAVEIQAINRAHRIGQDKNVFAYRFITKNSIEEKILKLKARKSELADSVIGESVKTAQLTIDELKELFA